MADSVTTLPLTSLFTPPSSCSSVWWTYENSGYNSIDNGLLIQNAINHIQSECFPPSWSNFGRAQATQVYSPGWCPKGYTTAVEQNGAATSATCCLSDYSYFTTLTTGGGSSTVVFAGCLSQFPAKSTTTVLNRGDEDILNTTVVSGPITAWAVPLTIEVAATQTHLFVSSTKTPKPAGAVTTSATPTSTVQPAHTSSSSSTGEKVGIGVGVAVGVSLILGAIGFFFWRRRRRQTIGKARPDMPPELDDKQTGPGELDGQGLPPGELQGNSVNPELPGSQPTRGKSVKRQSGPPVELEA